MTTSDGELKNNAEPQGKRWATVVGAAAVGVIGIAVLTLESPKVSSVGPAPLAGVANAAVEAVKEALIE